MKLPCSNCVNTEVLERLPTAPSICMAATAFAADARGTSRTVGICGATREASLDRAADLTTETAGTSWRDALSGEASSRAACLVAGGVALGATCLHQGLDLKATAASRRLFQLDRCILRGCLGLGFLGPSKDFHERFESGSIVCGILRLGLTKASPAAKTTVRADARRADWLVEASCARAQA